MQASVIFTTYNAPRWLEKVLWGFAGQDTCDFEIIIADDGSGSETRAVVERAAADMEVPVRHIWQPDQGFRKCRILNQAIKAAEADYLIFTDGDCIPRQDFVSTHLAHARPGWFLSGGYYKLPLPASRAIDKTDVASGRAFALDWLAARGLKRGVRNLKLTSRGRQARMLNALTPTRPTWNGHNASAWKTDLLAVNGFDERMHWGGEDRELGERLVNAGLRGRQIRYSAICVHLDHARPYAKPELVAYNKALRTHVRRHGVVRTPFGINPFADPLAQQFEALLTQRDLQLSGLTAGA